MRSPEQQQVRLLMAALALFAALVAALSWWMKLSDDTGRIGWWIPIACTVLPLAGGLGLWWYRRRQAHRSADRLEKVLTGEGQPGNGGESAEIVRMRQEFATAVGALKGSKLGSGSGRDALYTLPWYAIIGPPASGKTTLLQESGLKFPHLSGTGARPNLKGRGGTKNCDWFLTPEAIMLDTAGRWSTEQAQEDRDAWVAFLTELRKNRSDVPLNGVLVAVSLADDAGGMDPSVDDFPSIAGLDEGQLELLAARIRERLDEITQILRVTLPVYVLFTKCDLLSGFCDTFGGLSEHERQQIWGATARVGEAGAEPRAFVSRCLGELEKQLDKHAMTRMSELVGDEELARVSAFPAQFRSVGPKVASFVDQLLRHDPFTEPPVLRGLYFTCGTQEGTPLSLIAQDLGVDADHDDDDEVRKSYFIHDVLRRVVFKDRDLAVTTASEAGRRRLVRRVWMTGATAAAALLLANTVYSLNVNRAILQDTRDTVQQLHSTRNTARTPWGPLEDLAALERELDRYENSHGLFVGALLYQGSTVKEGLERYFANEMVRHVIAPLYSKNNGALHLAQPSQNDSATVQVVTDALQLALMLANREQLAMIDSSYRDNGSCGECRIPSAGESEVALGRLLALWDACYPRAQDPKPCNRIEDFARIDAGFAKSAAKQARHQNDPRYRLLRRYLGLLSPSLDRPPKSDFAMRPDAKITMARGVLQAEDPAGRALLGLRGQKSLSGEAELLAWPGAGPLRVQKIYLANGSAAVQAATKGSGVFNAQLEQSKWVLGCGCQSAVVTTEATQEQLLAKYAKDREQAWRQALASQRLAPPTSLDEAMSQLRQMADGGPAHGFFAQLRQHTAPLAPPVAMKAVEQVAGVAGDAVNAVMAAAPKPWPDAFEGLNRFGAQQLTPYQNAATSVLTKLDAYMQDSTEASLQAVRAATAAGLRTVEAQARAVDGWNGVLEGLLVPPFRGLQALLEREDGRLERRGRIELAKSLQSAWCTDFYADYRDYLADRFPFERRQVDGQGRRLPFSAVPQASFKKFQELFGRDGTLASLVESGPLSGYVQRQGKRYQKAGGSGFISRDLLTFLNEAHRVRDLVFDTGVQFAVGISPAGAKVTIGGQPVESGGVAAWPSSGVEVVTPAGDQWTMAGDWALLVMLDGIGCADAGEPLCEVTGRCEPGCPSEMARVTHTSSQVSPCGTRACYYGLYEQARVTTRTPSEIRIGLQPRQGRRTYLSFQFTGGAESDPIRDPGYFSRLVPPERIVAGGAGCP